MPKLSMTKRYLDDRMKGEAIRRMKFEVAQKLFDETADGEIYSFRWNVSDYQDFNGRAARINLWIGKVNKVEYVPTFNPLPLTWRERLRVLFTGDISKYVYIQRAK